MKNIAVYIFYLFVMSHSNLSNGQDIQDDKKKIIELQEMSWKRVLFPQRKLLKEHAAVDSGKVLVILKAYKCDDWQYFYFGEKEAYRANKNGIGDDF